MSMARNLLKAKNGVFTRSMMEFHLDKGVTNGEIIYLI